MTQVCVIKYNQRDNEKSISQIIPVAGTFPSHSLDAKTSLLGGEGSDENVYGVRIELHGKEYKERQQSTIIELSCDHSIEVLPRIPLSVSLSSLLPFPSPFMGVLPGTLC